MATGLIQMKAEDGLLNEITRIYKMGERNLRSEICQIDKNGQGHHLEIQEIGQYLPGIIGDSP